jgi:putative SOS response-associated peptidase YedK
MCGRYAFFASADQVAERFQVSEPTLFDARYNIAPSQTVVAVRTVDRARTLARLRWGLIPSWATDPTIAYKLINARAETVAEKPSFRSAFKQRRCLIPASGFYEWKKEGKRKQPFFIRPRDGGLFALAGLWERWQAPEGEIVETCTILTTEANELMLSLHDRMPVIIDTAAEDVWLDPRSSPDALRSLFVPFASEEMEAIPLNPWVSNPKHEGPRCLEPMGA